MPQAHDHSALTGLAHDLRLVLQKTLAEGPGQREPLHLALGKLARAHGYSDWSPAYHALQKAKPKDWPGLSLIEQMLMGASANNALHVGTGRDGQVSDLNRYSGNIAITGKMTPVSYIQEQYAWLLGQQIASGGGFLLIDEQSGPQVNSHLSSYLRWVNREPLISFNSCDDPELVAGRRSLNLLAADPGQGVTASDMSELLLSILGRDGVSRIWSQGQLTQGLQNVMELALLAGETFTTRSIRSWLSSSTALSELADKAGPAGEEPWSRLWADLSAPSGGYGTQAITNAQLASRFGPLIHALAAIDGVSGYGRLFSEQGLNLVRAIRDDACISITGERSDGLSTAPQGLATELALRQLSIAFRQYGQRPKDAGNTPPFMVVLRVDVREHAQLIKTLLDQSGYGSFSLVLVMPSYDGLRFESHGLYAALKEKVSVRIVHTPVDPEAEARTISADRPYPEPETSTWFQGLRKPTARNLAVLQPWECFVIRNEGTFEKVELPPHLPTEAHRDDLRYAVFAQPNS